MLKLMFLFLKLFNNLALLSFSIIILPSKLLFKIE